MPARRGRSGTCRRTCAVLRRRRLDCFAGVQSPYPTRFCWARSTPVAMAATEHAPSLIRLFIVKRNYTPWPEQPSSMKALGPGPRFPLQDVVTAKPTSRTDVAGPRACSRCSSAGTARSSSTCRRACDDRPRLRAGRGVGIVAIQLNDVASHPEDSPTKLAYQAQGCSSIFLISSTSPGGRARVRRAVHAGLFSLRRRWAAGLSSGTRRRPAAHDIR